ncbi:hypothetical protein AAHA92_00524 [Salvia divinorum]|uniref:Phytocyanin domain-containing protein n=1 Tax=Salvia divinorum TaxID=28513 RepID=A0ABD1IN21_SALDI
MALRVLLMMMMVAAALAIDHIVGDKKGWNTDIPYTPWVDGLNFHVGDSITFMYTAQEHNVIKVNRTEFQRCIYSSAAENKLTSGFDVVHLTTLAPAPVSGSSASRPSASTAAEVSPAMKYYLWLISIVVVHSARSLFN